MQWVQSHLKFLNPLRTIVINFAKVASYHAYHNSIIKGSLSQLMDEYANSKLTFASVAKRVFVFWFHCVFSFILYIHIEI